MALSDPGSDRPLGSRLVEIVSSGSDWDSQGEPPEQIVAAVNLEITHVIEQSWEHAQQCRYQHLIDVLEHLVVRRGQGQLPGDRAYFDMAIERLLRYIDDHNVGGSHKDPWQALPRLLKIRGLLIGEGAPTNRIDQTIKSLKQRLAPLRELSVDVRPADSVSQAGDNQFSLRDLPGLEPGFFGRQQSYLSPGLKGSGGIYGRVDSEIWMQTDDSFLNPIRVAFLEGASGFALSGDQLLFEYYLDRRLFLFTRREEGHLPVVVKEFSCSPEQISRVTVDVNKSYMLLDIQDFPYRILINAVASLLKPWLRRLRKLNLWVPIEVTRLVSSE